MNTAHLKTGAKIGFNGKTTGTVIGACMMRLYDGTEDLAVLVTLDDEFQDYIGGPDGPKRLFVSSVIVHHGNIVRYYNARDEYWEPVRDVAGRR